MKTTKRIREIKAEMKIIVKAIGTADFRKMQNGAIEGSDLFHRHFDLFCELKNLGN